MLERLSLNSKTGFSSSGLLTSSYLVKFLAYYSMAAVTSVKGIL